MKLKNKILIISLSYLLILFPVNLISQDLYTPKDELVVFNEANLKSDTIYTLQRDDKVVVLGIRSIWFRKWAKIQLSTGELGYVIFHNLKPIDTNHEIQEKNTTNEEASTQNTAVRKDYSESQNENRHDFNNGDVNISEENTQKTATSSNNQDNYVTQPNKHSDKSFPTWGWFAIIVTIAFAYATYQYKKYLYQKFKYNIFSLTTLISLLLSFGVILSLNYTINHNQNLVLWGIPNDTFKILLVSALILTIVVLYYYNFRKTNWYFAIFNIIIQSVAVCVFFVIAIGWIILEFLGTRSKANSQSNPSGPSISTAIQKGDYVSVYDENNRELFSRYGKLKGYTGTTVSIKDNSSIHVYNIEGRVVSSHYTG